MFKQAMSVTTQKRRLRNAEKHRKFSTCKFADRIYLCATKKLDDIVSKGYWPEAVSVGRGTDSIHDTTGTHESQQNVLAAFIIHNTNLDTLKCISLGMGTKFVDKQGNIDDKGYLIEY